MIIAHDVVGKMGTFASKTGQSVGEMGVGELGTPCLSHWAVVWLSNWDNFCIFVTRLHVHVVYRLVAYRTVHNPNWVLM